MHQECMGPLARCRPRHAGGHGLWEEERLTHERIRLGDIKGQLEARHEFMRSLAPGLCEWKLF